MGPLFSEFTKSGWMKKPKLDLSYPRLFFSHRVIVYLREAHGEIALVQSQPHPASCKKASEFSLVWGMVGRNEG